MKKFQIFGVAFSLVVLSLFACNQAVEDKAIEVGGEQLAKVEMKVEGMVCAMGCAKYIEDNVAKMDGVKESKVDFETGIAYFSFDEKTLNAEELEKFIDEIHDGQYQATIISDSDVKEVETEEIEEVDEVEETEEVASVVNKIQNISFPELLTYFMKRL